MTTMGNPKILVEVPANEAYKKQFQKIYEKAIFRKFRKMGMSRSDSKHSVQVYLKKWREVFHRRIPLRQSP